jgi:glycine/D-amino acid oxidase-like deaminating enzyme
MLATAKFKNFPGSVEIDVTVIGTDFTKLSTAPHLAKVRKSITVLETEKFGFGASGQNNQK